MSASAPDGSIASRDTSRPDLLAFEVKAKITKPDIEWMASIADEAMKAHGEIDMLIVMSNFEGTDLGAAFDSHALGVQTRSVAHIRRYAVVGAPLFARGMIEVSGAITPVKTKTFNLAEERDAWAWVDEDRQAKQPNDSPTEPSGGARDLDNPTPS